MHLAYRLLSIIMQYTILFYILNQETGGSVSRYPDGQLAMPVFDNGGSQASSDVVCGFNVQCAV